MIKRRISELSHVTRKRIPNSCTQFIFFLLNLIKRCSSFFCIFIILGITITILITLVFVGLWLLVHYNHASWYQHHISKSKLEKTSTFVLDSLMQSRSVMNSLKSFIPFNQDQIQSSSNQLFNILLNDSLSSTDPRQYLGLSNAIKSIYQIQYKAHDEVISGWRRMEDFNPLIYEYSYRPTDSEIQLIHPMGNRNITNNNIDFYNELTQTSSSGDLLSRVDSYENSQMLSITLVNGTSSYIGIMINISSLLPLDSAKDSLAFIVDRSTLNLLGSNQHIGSTISLNSKEFDSPFYVSTSLISTISKKFKNSLNSYLSWIEDFLKDFKKSQTELYLTPTSRSSNTYFQHISIPFDNQSLNWIIFSHISSGEYTVSLLYPLLTSLVGLPLILIFCLFIIFLFIYILIFWPIHKIVTYLSKIQTESESKIKTPYILIRELNSLLNSLFEITELYNLYKGFIPVHVQSIIKNQNGIESETDAESAVIPYDIGADIHDMNSFTSARTSKIVSMAKLLKDIPNSRKSKVYGENIQSDKKMKRAPSKEQSFYKSFRKSLSGKSFKKSLNSIRNINSKNQNIIKKDSTKLLDIGLKATNGTVLAIRICNLPNILNLENPQNYLLQFGKLSDIIHEMIQSSKGVISYFNFEEFVITWLEDSRNHIDKACSFCNNVIKDIDEWDCSINTPKLDVRFGISSGSVCVGNIGNSVMKKYVVIGDVFDTAIHISRETKFYNTRILVDSNSYSKLSSEYLMRPISFEIQAPLRLHPSGMGSPITIFQLGEKFNMGDQEWLYTLSSQQLMEQWDIYNAAYRFMKLKNYQDAIQKFKFFLEMYPNDIPAIQNLKYCEDRILDNNTTENYSSSKDDLSYDTINDITTEGNEGKEIFDYSYEMGKIDNTFEKNIMLI